MVEKTQTRISSWNPERGFGFAQVNGKRVFIHFSVLSPRPARGSDLTGQEIVIGEVDWKAQKGPRVVAAETLEKYDRRQMAEQLRKEREAQEAAKRAVAAEAFTRKILEEASQKTMDEFRSIAQSLRERAAEIIHDRLTSLSVKLANGSRARVYLLDRDKLVEEGDTRPAWLLRRGGSMDYKRFASQEPLVEEIVSSGLINARVFHGFASKGLSWKAEAEWESWHVAFPELLGEMPHPDQAEDFVFCKECRKWHEKNRLEVKAIEQKWGSSYLTYCPAGHCLGSKAVPFKEVQEMLDRAAGVDRGGRIDEHDPFARPSY